MINRKSEGIFTNAEHTAIFTIDYINQLTAERDRFKAERDAAIADLRKLSVRPSYIQCDCCLHFQKADGIKYCLKKPDFSGKCWEWRGVQR